MSCPDEALAPPPKAYTPVLLDCLEGDISVSGYYPSGTPLQLVITETGNGVKTHYTQAAIGRLVPGTFVFDAYYYNLTDVPNDPFTGTIVDGSSEVLGTIDYYYGTWDFTIEDVPAALTPLTTTVTPVPSIAVLLDDVKLGEAWVEFNVTPTSQLYDDGEHRDSLPWTFDLIQAYDATTVFNGDGDDDTFAASPGKPIILGTFHAEVHPSGETYHDQALDANFGHILTGSGARVGTIAYTAGTWTFTTPAGHTTPSGGQVIVTVSFVPPDNAPTALIKRDRVTVRARVQGFSWSDLSSRIALTQFFRKNLVTLLPPEYNYLDDPAQGGTGDLASFIQVFAVTMDELKDMVDSFTEIFNVDYCESKYLPYIAQYLGYDLNLSDPVDFQRRQLKNAVAWYKVKGTFESFKIFFYSLGYQIQLYELWTEDYLHFATGLPATYRGATGLTTYDFIADSVPDNDVRLLENGGTWYRSPHFAIELNSIVTPNLTAVGLRYILSRISKIRPAHTVLDYLKFEFCMSDKYVITHEDYYNTAILEQEDDGWLAGYCTPGDPIFVRSGRKFPNWGSPPNYSVHIGTKAFPTRNGTDATAIHMYRIQVPTICNPPEDQDFRGIPWMHETYYIDLLRDGMGLVPASGPWDPDRIDHSTFPYRGMSGTVLRDGQFRYLDTFVPIGMGPIYAIAALSKLEESNDSMLVPVGATLTAATRGTATPELDVVSALTDQTQTVQGPTLPVIGTLTDVETP